MKKKWLFVVALILSLFVGMAISMAQTDEIEKLRNDQQKTLERLATTSKLLAEAKGTTTTSLNKLNVLTKQIADRQLLIRQLSRELILIDKQIIDLKTEIDKEQKRLDDLKESYAELVYRTHVRSNSHDKLMFILSAKTFAQSYRRLRYLQELSTYRKEQAEEIKALTVSLTEKLAGLEKRKVQRTAALEQREKENTRLLTEKEQQQGMVAVLEKKEKELTAELATHQRQMDNLNNRIAKLIQEEEERREKERREAEEKAAREKALKEGKPVPPPSTTVTSPELTLTKEEKLIAGGFEKNKGRLPWPVEKGIITGKFGMQPHPTLQHVTVNNKGIYVQTEMNADTRAVFEGEVTQRFSIPGSNNTVIVRHGNYRTVYSNLTELYVKEGDKVTPKQKIGKIYTDTDNGNQTVLYFQVWKDKELQNPELWLTK